MHSEIKKFFKDAGYELVELGSGSFGDKLDYLIRSFTLKKNGKYIHCHPVAESEKILFPITDNKIANVKFNYYYPITSIKLPLPNIYTEEEMLKVIKMKAFV